MLERDRFISGQTTLMMSRTVDRTRLNLSGKAHAEEEEEEEDTWWDESMGSLKNVSGCGKRIWKPKKIEKQY